MQSTQSNISSGILPLASSAQHACLRFTTAAGSKKARWKGWLVEEKQHKTLMTMRNTLKILLANISTSRPAGQVALPMLMGDSRKKYAIFAKNALTGILLDTWSGHRTFCRLSGLLANSKWLVGLITWCLIPLLEGDTVQKKAKSTLNSKCQVLTLAWILVRVWVASQRHASREINIQHLKSTSNNHTSNLVRNWMCGSASKAAWTCNFKEIWSKYGGKERASATFKRLLSRKAILLSRWQTSITCAVSKSLIIKLQKIILGTTFSQITWMAFGSTIQMAGRSEKIAIKD